MSLVYADYQSNLIHHYGGGRLACFEAVSFFSLSFGSPPLLSLSLTLIPSFVSFLFPAISAFLFPIIQQFLPARRLCVAAESRQCNVRPVMN